MDFLKILAYFLHQRFQFPNNREGYLTKRASPISDLKNFAKTSERWLNEIGVYTKEDLKRLGSIHAYRLLKERGFNVSLNMVYAIEATLLDLHWQELPSDLKAELREAIRNLGAK